MKLPLEIHNLIQRLEDAGFAAYAVGGCVRDSVLGLTPHDYDLCTAALPEQIQAVFADCPMFLTGLKHGTVSLITELGVVEITTFRTEGDYTDSRHPGWVKFLPEIEGDLARRDFTVNAMAYSPIRGFADPFGGRADLERKVLRAVGDPAERFREDALRILRGVRFAVRFGLVPEEATLNAMLEQKHLMDALARERVFSELCGMLPHMNARQLLTFVPIIAQVIPELEPAIGFDQRSPHHAFDLFTHIAHVTASVSGDVTMRWAGLLHDVGKVATFTTDETGRGHFYGHARVSAEMADEILRRLHAPNGLREEAVWLIEQHMTPLEPDKLLLKKRLSRWGEERTLRLLELQQADFGSKGTGAAEDDGKFRAVRRILEEILAEKSCLGLKDLAIHGGDLLEIGYAPGKELGRTLEQLLEKVLDGTIQNTREELLFAAISQKSEKSTEMNVKNS